MLTSFWMCTIEGRQRDFQQQATGNHFHESKGRMAYAEALERAIIANHKGSLCLDSMVCTRPTPGMQS